MRSMPTHSPAALQPCALQPTAHRGPRARSLSQPGDLPTLCR